MLYLCYNKTNKTMEEKFKLIENKKELFSEISVATGRVFGTIKNHWFNPVDIPEKHKEIVNDLLDRRIRYQEEVKKLHLKYFGL